MVFSSLLFLFRFLPAVLLAYYVAPRRWRNLILFLSSLVFYAWGEPVYLILMLVSILTSYTGGRLMDYFRQKGKQRAAKGTLRVFVLVSLGILAFFKYADFAIGTVNSLTGTDIALFHLALPIGISFYTFQEVSYLLDLYGGEAHVQKNLISYGAYIAMFPQLIAGPIVQYKTVDVQLRTRRESSEQFSEGVRRFLLGLGKKTLLADNMGALWETVRTMEYTRLPAASAWLGLAAYTLQIYFDFSAYSDMAIGLGHMFGFRFLENFNYPYSSKSITEFWRRWHISLGSWFREYVYIPLGGNRAGRSRHIRNIWIVWMLTGIWHGASWNFALWGMYYGILLLTEKYLLGDWLKRLPDWFGHMYCMFFVMLGWNLFVFEDPGMGTRFLKSLFNVYGQGLWNGETVYLLYNHAVLLLLCILGCTKLPRETGNWLCRKLENHQITMGVIQNLFYAAVFLFSVAWLVDATFQPFLYFRF